MAHYNKPKSEKEFLENFAQKKPLMNKTEAYYEASRCLFCYDAPCMDACPTGIDIPLFIKQIHTENITGSAKTIYESNWMGNACGTVCPTGVLCEGACVYNHQDVAPVQIGRLQNYATKLMIDSSKQLFTPEKDNGKRIAIIGAGPAGLSCACELRMLGYQVDIFEAKEKPSGLTIYGIAPYKITNEEVLEEIDYLQSQLQFKIYYNDPISSKERIAELERDYNALFIGVGLGLTAERDIKGIEKKGVFGAVEFIEDLRMKHHKTEVGKEVVIIGGGNTAMDAASESARMGANNVTIVYRRSKEEMGAYPFEFELATKSGVQSIFNAAPVEIYGKDSVSSVSFSKTVMQDGKLTAEKDSEFSLMCDMVIMATGQEKNKTFYDLIDQLEYDKSGKLKVDVKNYQTSNPKYFAGGDAINGGAEVVNAAFDGKMAAQGINEYLSIK